MAAAMEVELAHAETWSLVEVRHRQHLDKQTGRLRTLGVFATVREVGSA